MRKILLFIISILVLFLCRSTSPGKGPKKEVVLTIVYNNVPYDRRLATPWGFSCLIEGKEKTILFDTGGNGSILLSNMKKLKINPKDIDIIIISHFHADHYGGLFSVLEKNNKITVYLPEWFPAYFKKRVGKACKEVILVSKPAKICKGVWSTGEMKKYLREQSLLIETKDGIVIVTGCAHPGVVNIARRAKQLLKKEIYLITGGFHLIGYPGREILQIIGDLKKLGVKKTGPSHCSGELAIELFRQAWGKDFVDLGCGAKIKIPNRGK